MTATATRTIRQRTAARAPRPAPPSRRRWRRWLLIAAAGLLLVVLAPVVLLAGVGNPPCATTTTGGARSGVGAISGVTAGGGGHFTGPLHLAPGRWYRVGATEYGGDWGASPTQSFLPAYPDTFAELSTLDVNPATGGLFTFTDADALGNLPYLTGLRVAVGGREMVLYKRDIGYGQGPTGQGPGSLIYRIDVWQTAAQKLGITKTPVAIQLAPVDGTAPTLGQLPAPPTTAGSCAPTAGAPTTTLPVLNPTSEAQIGADGIATAPAAAPRAVKLAVAAANQIADKPYPVPDVHYDADDLTSPWPAYDCSATVSYVLYHAGLRGATATDSTGLESYGLPGPGRWISVYANSAHTWIVIAGRAFDTSHYGGLDTPAGTGPRWEPDPTANLADNNSYIVRHPAGL